MNYLENHYLMTFYCRNYFNVNYNWNIEIRFKTFFFSISFVFFYMCNVLLLKNIHQQYLLFLLLPYILIYILYIYLDIRGINKRINDIFIAVINWIVFFFFLLLNTRVAHYEYFMTNRFLFLVFMPFHSYFYFFFFFLEILVNQNNGFSRKNLYIIVL